MTEKPLVSICIPTYNRAGMIAGAIESSLSQSYSPIEVIIVDNDSTDNTAEVVTKYTDPRVKYFRNKENLGLFGNYNRCIELARGEYIHILHSDDIIDPRFTEATMKFFEDHPSVKMTTTSASILTKSSEIDISYADRDMLFIAPDGLMRLLSDRNFIVCPSVTVHRDVYSVVGHYSLEYPYSSDFYQWFKIARRYDVGFVHGAMLKYRQGEHSETFRLLFQSPAGYLDTIKILVQMQKEIYDDGTDFSEPMNMAIRRYIGDCIFAGFTRAEDMRGFSPVILPGLALTSWSLLIKKSWKDWFRTAPDLLMIGGAWLLISISPLRKLVKRLLIRKNEYY